MGSAGQQQFAGQGSGTLPEAIDVLLVGLGPVGATIANLLGIQGVSTLVLDKAAQIYTAPRAIALDYEALRILQLAGLDENAFERIAIPNVRMHSPYVGEFVRINTAGCTDGHPKLVTFYQPELEQALRSTLAGHGSVEVALGVELLGFVETQEAVVAEVRRADGSVAKIRARYLIGADGASSLVRQLVGQQFLGRTYGEDWLIVDARKVPAPIDHVEFLCDPRRPTPHMVAPGERERWEFMLQPGETREQIESEASIRQLLARWLRPEDMQIERKAVYRFHARTVDCFGKGRVFLAGDAAHITPPFIGQGLVAGLRDAANLCWKLAWALRGTASAQILDSYDVERRPHAKAMIRLAKFMGQLVMPRNPLAALLLHGFMRLLRLPPPLRTFLENNDIKPKNRFSRGLFCRGRSGSGLVRGGLLPQGWVRAGDGSVCLSDDVLGAGLALVGFGVDVASQLEASAAAEFLAAGGRVVQIRHRGQGLHLAEPDQTWEDLEGRFLPSAVPFGWVAVVRPDRIVLHEGPASQVNELLRESLAMLRGRRPQDAAPAVAAAP